MSKYQIPKNIKTKIDTAIFINTFVNELHKIWEYSDTPLLNIDANTIGWYSAFCHTCEQLDLQHIITYEDDLSWDDSELFAEEVAQLIPKYINNTKKKDKRKKDKR